MSPQIARSDWAVVASARGACGAVEAVLETLVHDPSSFEDPSGAQVGSQWLVRPWGTLARRDGNVVLERALHPWRVRSVGEESAGVLGRLMAGTEARTEVEAAVLGLAGAGGLAARCRDGLPEPEPGPDLRSAWTEADARFVAGFSYAPFGGRTCGATWTGHRGERFPGSGPASGPGERGRVRLEASSESERPVPRSARCFSGGALDVGVIGRWLGRFAHARATRVVERPGSATEGFLRGCPEGGGGGTTVVTLAVLDVEGLCAGVYRYDFQAHELVWIDADPVPVAASVRANYDTLLRGSPPVVGCLSARMDRMGAKYARMALSTSMINAGVFLAGAYRAAASEGLALRGCGVIDGALWQTTLGVSPLIECALCSFGLGRER